MVQTQLAASETTVSILHGVTWCLFLTNIQDNLELNLPDLSATVSQDEISGPYRDLQGLNSESNHHEQLENNFVDSWWPIGGLDWLNSVPVDFNDNLPNINSQYASAGQAGPSIPDSGVGTDPRRVASPGLSL